jgi:hypothetical protein
MDSIHLIGAEDVRSAGNRMASADVAVIARALCKRYDRQAREDGRPTGALVAYNAGVGMTIKFWNDMAKIALRLAAKQAEQEPG